MSYRRDFEWIEPFAELEDMERYIRDREDEASDRVQWALGEMARHRSVVDTAFHEALNRYAPSLHLSASDATGIMDGMIVGRFRQDRQGRA
jgi:hypothetical protein